MNTEETFWYVFHFFFVIMATFIAHIVLKYIRKKPLGMQTMFDEIIKDTIYLSMLDMISTVIVFLFVLLSITYLFGYKYHGGCKYSFFAIRNI